MKKVKIHRSKMELKRISRYRKGYTALTLYGTITLIVFVVGLYKGVLFKQIDNEIRMLSERKFFVSSEHLPLGRLPRRSKRVYQKRYRILWYTPPRFLQLRTDAMYSGFEDCEYRNCFMTQVESDAPRSDAIIFTKSLLPRNFSYNHEPGQIWILADDFPAVRRYPEMWSKENVFNWTISYRKHSSDLYLPYGKIKPKSAAGEKDFYEIAKNKTKSALIIMSRCNTPAKRQLYLNKLKRLMDVDILGRCGKPFNCGIKYLHDNCYNVVNQYKFFLAFEDSLCSDYFTDRIFENYDYDTVLVTRGGLKGQIKDVLPERTYIAAEDFKGPKELAAFLKSMSMESYVNILKAKHHYQSEVHAYVFREPMCEICSRLNNIDKYRQTIRSIDNLLNSDASCVPPNDIY